MVADTGSLSTSQAAAWSASAVRRRRLVRAVVVNIGRVIALATPIWLWETAVNRGWMNPFVASSPTRIWARLLQWMGDGTIARNIGFTFRNAVVGYILGLVLGAAIAIMFTALPKVGRIYLPFMTTMNSIPRFAFAPLLIAWLGFGPSSVIALVVLVTLWIQFFAIYGGLSSINQDYIQWAKSLGASELEIWTNVRLPAIVRWVLSSLRISIGFALSAAIVGEFVGGSVGMGHLISYSVNLFRAASVYAGIAVVVVVVGTLDAILRYFERRWTHWVGAA